jgi:flagellar L-ring protein precursor FlgH
MATRLISAFVFGAACLGGCSVLPPQPLTHSPGFAPVYPVAATAPEQATGSLYNAGFAETFLGRGRNFQVGDVITVVLSESTQASRVQSGKLERTSSNNVLPTDVLGGGLLGTKAALLGGTIKTDGSGTADQTASLSGSVVVTVVDVMANGNLVVRGEKQLALTEGSEIIQVGGVIRPEDVAPNNTVQSKRLANAQITYRGTGDMAATARAGWGTSALLKLWPF